MANQEMIQALSDELTERIVTIQTDIINGILDTVKCKTNAESIKIINNINMPNVINLKSKSIMQSYQSGLVEVLKSKEMFANITEDTLSAFYETSKQEIFGELLSMGNILKKELINGILNDEPVEDITENIRKQGYGV